MQMKDNPNIANEYSNANVGGKCNVKTKHAVYKKFNRITENWSSQTPWKCDGDIGCSVVVDPLPQVAFMVMIILQYKPWHMSNLVVTFDEDKKWQCTNVLKSAKE